MSRVPISRVAEPATQPAAWIKESAGVEFITRLAGMACQSVQNKTRLDLDQETA